MPVPLTAGTPGWFNHGNLALGSPFTTLSSDWCNGVQAEILSVLAAASITPNKLVTNQLLTAIQTIVRIKVTSLALYVATTGSDTANNGLSSVTPFKTIQHATTVAQGYDLSGGVATIYVANGTYAAGAGVTGLNLNGSIHYIGNTASPTSCKITLPGGGACFAVAYGAVITVSGFAMEVPSGGPGTAIFGSNGIGLLASNGGEMTFDHCAFGVCSTSHISANIGGFISVPGNLTPYAVYGSAPSHVSAGNMSVITLAGSVVSLSGALAFSTAFATSSGPAVLYAPLMTFPSTGSVTGQRYSAGLGGAIFTSGGGANFFPGTLAGTSTTGFYV
jgi:hypothetical protein